MSNEPEMSNEIEFADRYSAVGMPYPDVATICQGQCEGMGCVPIGANETEPRFKALWEEAHAKEHSEPCDGVHFVVCPDCHGTGKRPAPNGEQTG